MRLPTLALPCALLALAGPAVSWAAADCPGANDPPTADTLGPAAVATICVLNDERAAAGRAPVELDMGLTMVGFDYARTLVAEGYFDHITPSGGDLSDRLGEIGYPGDGAGENLYWGSGVLNTPAATVKGWMESEDHRSNMLDPEFRRVGIGIALGAPVAGVVEAVTYVADFDTGPPEDEPSASPEPAAVEPLGAPRSIPGPPPSAATLVKRAARAWMEAGRTGDAAAFCRLQDNRMLLAQTGKTDGAGLTACQERFRANAALPPASGLRITGVTTAATKASLTMRVLDARVKVGLRKRDGRWKVDSVRA